jgi:hypothetical protein
MNKLKIWWLHRKARRALHIYMDEEELHDCGHNMLKTISSRAREAAYTFNSSMMELQKIDPNCPSWVAL